MYLETVNQVSLDAHLAFEKSPMPVSAMAANYPDGYLIEKHSHTCAQLLYAVQGIMTIQADKDIWVVPPSRAVWICAGLEHTVRMSGLVMMRTVFIKNQKTVLVPNNTCVVRISNLLKELILSAIDISATYLQDSRDGKLVSLLLDELRFLSALPMHIQWPRDEKYRQVCNRISKHPSENTTVDEWSAKLSVSAKTFSRAFIKETGISFGKWRQQARLLSALEKIAAGEKILTVALEHGYESQSAFTYMFKKQLGLTPTEFY